MKSRLVALGLTIAAATTLAGPRAYSQEAFGGRTVAVPVVRAETEDGAIHVGNWTTVYEGLRAMVARPQADDAAIIAEVQAMGDAAPPPYLMEMGRRIARTDLAEGAYWFHLGRWRGTWSGSSCRDRSALGGLRIVDITLNQAAPDEWKRLFDPAVRLTAFERLGEDNAVFSGRASAWWICSHGMQAMMGGMNGDGKTVPVETWLIDAPQRDALRIELTGFQNQGIEQARALLAAESVSPESVSP